MNYLVFIPVAIGVVYLLVLWVVGMARLWRQRWHAGHVAQEQPWEPAWKEMQNGQHHAK